VAELIAAAAELVVAAAVTACFRSHRASLGIAAAVWRAPGSTARPRRCGRDRSSRVPRATLAVLVFAVQLRWLPALSYVSDIESLGQLLRAFAMPVLTLCCVIVAQMMRMSRAAVIDQLEAPYIEMVRLKGASPLRTVLAHALPNAVGPIANAVALSLSYLLGGVIIVETIFNYPGIAKLMVDGVSQRDMPLVQTCAMLFCTAYLFLVTTADVCGISRQPAAAASLRSSVDGIDHDLAAFRAYHARPGSRR
jgi:peptide/nickel transport system permease protein